MTRSSPTPFQAVFVDTSAHYALSDRQDTNHEAATTIGHRLQRERPRLFTTNFVLAETHALLLTRLGRHVARRFLEQMDRSTFTVVRITEADERRAREVLQQYDDKDFSLTDATSFAVMERLAISHAFAFDRHFAQYGLAVLAPDPPDHR